MTHARFKKLYLHWSTELKVEKTIDYCFCQLKKQWGKFHKAASPALPEFIEFNAKLLELDQPLVEYVIVHELLHKWVDNHGILFQALLCARISDWEERDRALQGRCKAK